MVDISSVVFHFTFSLYVIKLSVVREHTVLPLRDKITHPLDVRKARDLSEYMKIYAFFHRTMSNQSLTTRPSSDIINTNIAQSDDRGK